jgi:predicted nucleic acid-binding protein
VREVVLDASVLIKWLSDAGEQKAEAARALEVEYRRGEIQVVVPYLLFLELINVASQRWAWPPERLIEMVGALRAARFGIGRPPLDRVAYWAGRGLTAYDACYVALAEDRRTVVITADERILAVAGELAERLGAARRELRNV